MFNSVNKSPVSSVPVKHRQHHQFVQGYLLVLLIYLPNTNSIKRFVYLLSIFCFPLPHKHSSKPTHSDKDQHTHMQRHQHTHTYIHTFNTQMCM